MLTFSRFVIAIVLLVCLFVVTWSLKFTPGPDQKSPPIAAGNESADVGESESASISMIASLQREDKASFESVPPAFSQPADHQIASLAMQGIALEDPTADPNSVRQNDVEVPQFLGESELDQVFPENENLENEIVGSGSGRQPSETRELNSGETSNSHEAVVESRDEPKRTPLVGDFSETDTRPDLKVPDRLSSPLQNQLGNLDESDDNQEIQNLEVVDRLPQNSRIDITPIKEDAPNLADKHQTGEVDPNAPPVPVAEEYPNHDSKEKSKVRSVLKKVPAADTNQPTKEPGLVFVSRPKVVNNKPIGFVKHRVEANDTLQSLAKKYLGDTGRYLDIYRLNSETVNDPSKLESGTLLKIPIY